MADGIKIRSLNVATEVKRDDVLIIDKLNTLTNENITHQILVDDFANALIANPDNKLTELADVIINNPQVDHALVWDGNYWVNKPVSTGGGGGTGTFEGDALVFPPSGTPYVFEVTIGNRTSDHRFQDNQFSTKSFFIDGVEAPALMLAPGRVYRFDQSHSSNANYRLQFFSAPTNTAFFGNSYADLNLPDAVKYFGTPGQPGAYSELKFTQKYSQTGNEWILESETPRVLFYNCENIKGDDFMGNSLTNIGKIEDGDFTFGDDIGGVFPMTDQSIRDLQSKVELLETQLAELLNS